MVSVSVRRDGREPVGRNAQTNDSGRGSAERYDENPGLIEQVDGFYDWAGRRLFLADGSPDPMTPGAYRYQTRPDLCDLSAHASDPASPHYEPPHLRHRPGDTWQIGGKPTDPEDPGPFGSSGWRPDSRTGRHRRDELPDPVPPWKAADDEEEAVETEAPPFPAADPPTRRRRPRFWQEERAGEARGEAPQEEPWRFEKLREDAWDRFVIKSSELAAAHWADRRALECQHRWPVAMVLRWIAWMVAVWQGRSVSEAPAWRSALPRQVRPHGERAARPVPGAQMARAIRSVQAARVHLAGADRRAAPVDRADAHWHGEARQERPRPSPLPYAAMWEQAFDAHRAFGEVAL